MRLDPRRVIAIVVVLVVTGCGSYKPAPQAQAQVPTDGVHMNGAITAVYPITDNATCNVAMVNADKVLQFKPNAKTGAVIGLELIKYKGAGTYSPLDWPPYQNSAAWVGLIGGHTWRAYGGQVTVTSDINGKVSGTLEATGMQEVGGTTTVNASGSWRCQTA
jgi:hypothetical protein